MNKPLFKRICYIGVFHQLCISSVSAQVIRDGFDSNFLAANDDGSTGLVDIGFDLNFFGNEYTQAYLNNNGNITFDQSLSSFTPSEIALPTTAIIAPFFADVDTRGIGSGLMTYGTGTVNGDAAFGVNWVDVGYYSASTDLLNSFQLVLIDLSDFAGEGAFAVEFNYGQIQWESGDANEGSVNGLGGETARVGYSNGNGTDFEEIEGSSTPGALLDGGANELISLTNVGEPGRFATFVVDGDILTSVPITGAEVSTLHDGVNQFTSFQTKDINGRLFRHRSAGSLNTFDSANAALDNQIQLFGSYNSFITTIDERTLANLGGLVATSVPEAELRGTSANVGLEYTFSNGWTAGVAALFSTGDLNHENATFTSDLDSQGAAFYVSRRTAATEEKMGNYIDLLVAHTDGDIIARRSVFGILSTLGETEFSSTEVQLNGGFEFRNNLLSHGPFTQLKMKSAEIDSYTEEETSFGSAVSPEIDIESTKFQIGYKASAQLGFLTPQVRVGYETELADQDSTVGTLQLAAPPENAFILGAGLAVDLNMGMYLALDYEHRRYDEGFTSNSVNIGGGMRF